MKKTLRVLVISTLTLSLALPFTAYAGTWQQDSTGWKVQNDNGTYLTNAWYQSPESGLFYYMGADGYMLTSTTTPDGYHVGADGVWIPSVTGTKHVTNGQIDTPSTGNQSNTNTSNNSNTNTYPDGNVFNWDDYAGQDGGGGTGGSSGNWSW